MQLYEDLNRWKTKAYDEDEFKRNHQGRPYLKQLASHKNILTENILRSLRIPSTHSNGFSIQESLEDARFLSSKFLTEMALRQIQKARKQAAKFERHESHLELLRLERTLHLNQAGPGYVQWIEGIHLKIESITRIVTLKYQILSIRDWFFLLSRKKNHALSQADREEMEKKINSQPMIAAANTEDFDIYSGYLFIRSIYHQLRGEMQEAWAMHRDLLQHWFEHPHFESEYKIQLRNALTNYLLLCNSIRQFDQFEQAVDKLENIRDLKPAEAADTRQNLLLIRLQYWIIKEKWHDANQVIAAWQKESPVLNKKITPARRLTFLLTAAWAFYLQKKLDQALSLLNQTKSLNKNKDRRELYHFVGAFKILIAISRNDENAESLVDNWDQSLRRANEKDGFHKTIAARLKAIVKSSTPSQKKKELSLFRSDLDQFDKDPALNNSFPLEILRHWLSQQ